MKNHNKKNYHRNYHRNMKRKRTLRWSITAGMLCLLIAGIWIGSSTLRANKNNGTNITTETEKQALQEDSVQTEKDNDTQMQSEDLGIQATTETETALSKEKLLQQQVAQKLATMTTEEKVAQLFIITPEALTGLGSVKQAGATTQTALQHYPVGGLIYFPENIVSEEQVTQMIKTQQQYSMERIGLPLLISVDEEGGKVARIASNASMNVPRFPNISEIGKTKDTAKAHELGDAIGSYLSRMGFNLDFAPVADVLTNPENTVVKNRSYGSDPMIVSSMVKQELTGLESHDVYGCIKHFPGHGATVGDTHEGYAYTEKKWEDLKASEVIPFQDCIAQGVTFVMVGHISLPNVTGNNTPASLSETMIKTYLQGELGYQGIVLTDALNMKAVTEQYTSAEAAVKAVNAGVDMLLMPADFSSAYAGVLSAAQNGTISQERLDASVQKILRAKMTLK